MFFFLLLIFIIDYFEFFHRKEHIIHSTKVDEEHSHSVEMLATIHINFMYMNFMNK